MTVAAFTADPRDHAQASAKPSFTTRDFLDVLADMAAITAHLVRVTGRQAMKQADDVENRRLYEPTQPEPAPIIARRARAAPAVPLGFPRLPRSPRLPNRIDWITLYSKLCVELCRVAKLNLSVDVPGAQAPANALRVDRLRSLLQDAARVDPTVHELDARLAAIEWRIACEDVPALLASGVPLEEVASFVAWDLGIAWPLAAPAPDRPEAGSPGDPGPGASPPGPEGCGPP